METASLMSPPREAVQLLLPQRSLQITGSRDQVLRVSSHSPHLNHFSNWYDFKSHSHPGWSLWDASRLAINLRAVPLNFWGSNKVAIHPFQEKHLEVRHSIWTF